MIASFIWQMMDGEQKLNFLLIGNKYDNQQKIEE